MATLHDGESKLNCEFRDINVVDMSPYPQIYLLKAWLTKDDWLKLPYKIKSDFYLWEESVDSGTGKVKFFSHKGSKKIHTLGKSGDKYIFYFNSICHGIVLNDVDFKNSFTVEIA